MESMTTDRIRRNTVGALLAVLAACLFAAPASAQPLDVDGNGEVDTFTDVVYCARTLFGLPAVPPSFRAIDPTIPADEIIAARCGLLTGQVPTPTQTRTATGTVTHTPSRTPTGTATATFTRTFTHTATATPTLTFTRTFTQTPTRTPPPTTTRTRTPSRTPTNSPAPIVMEGADAVRAAGEVTQRNNETFVVYDAGCASAKCSSPGTSAFQLGLRPRTAMLAGQPRQAATACPQGGSRTITCQGNVQTVVYANCAENAAANTHRVVRNGTARLTVPNRPTFCASGMTVDPLTDTVALELMGYTHEERNIATPSILYARLAVPGSWADTFAPDPDLARGCRPTGAAQDVINGTQMLQGSMSFECISGAATLPCVRGRTKLSLTARGLSVERSSGGFPCELGVEAVGEIDVVNEDLNFDQQTCTTTYSQRFARRCTGDMTPCDTDEECAAIDQGTCNGYFLGETPLGDGRSRIRQDGDMSVSALGDIRIETILSPATAATPGPTPPIGFILPAPDATPRDTSCGSDGDGIIRVKRPPLSVPVPPAAPAGGAGGVTSGGLRHDLFRATNGQVYQVLRNDDAFGVASGFRADALQITTLIGSEAGGVGQCAVTAGATVDPQAVAAVEPGKAFPPSLVRKSMIIPHIGNLQFNRNGAAGNGRLCVGPGCNSNGTCGGSCVSFTFDEGLAIDSMAAHAIPPATLVQLPDDPMLFPDPCGGFGGFFAYRFGAMGPTVTTRQCDPFPVAPAGDGFRLPIGSSVVFAYDTSFASLFNAAVAGFPVDTNDDNGIGCNGAGDQVLHLGVASLSSVNAPLISFISDANGPATVFDFEGDGTPSETRSGCVGISNSLSVCNP